MLKKLNIFHLFHNLWHIKSFWNLTDPHRHWCREAIQNRDYNIYRNRVFEIRWDLIINFLSDIASAQSKHLKFNPFNDPWQTNPKYYEVNPHQLSIILIYNNCFKIEIKYSYKTHLRQSWQLNSQTHNVKIGAKSMPLSTVSAAQF